MHPPGSLNRVPASAGVRAGMSLSSEGPRSAGGAQGPKAGKDATACMVHGTKSMKRSSVRLSVCPIDQQQQRWPAGLLLSALRARDIDRQRLRRWRRVPLQARSAAAAPQHDAQQQTRTVPKTNSIRSAVSTKLRFVTDRRSRTRNYNSDGQSSELFSSAKLSSMSTSMAYTAL